MSTGRLTFLYPHLFRHVRLSEAATTTEIQATRALRQSTRRRPSAVPFSTVTPARTASQTTKISGKPLDPLPPPSPPRTATRTASSPAQEPKAAAATSTSAKSTGQKSAKWETQNETPQSRIAAKDTSIQSTKPKSPAGVIETPTVTPERHYAPSEAIPLGAPKASEPSVIEALKEDSGPMGAILRMPPPSSSPPSDASGPHTSEEDRHPRLPHLTPPPYIHHFDTYSLVRQLTAGGFTEDQAITTMKAVRRLLAENLDLALSELVSKSDVENETYLFRAACSELSTEVSNNRRVADEQMRQHRTLLQHEVDILSQTLTGELLSLNDSVRGMFNDRRMAVREEQKAGDSAIQQLNYKISITLTSDAKSEIEGLRWVLIRRSVLGIIFMAVLMFGSLRYGSYVAHEKEREAERIAREKKAARKKALDGKHDRAEAPSAAEILAAN